MRILLTGGTGLIGRALCQHWQRQGHDLFVWSRDPAQVPRLCSGAQGIAQLQALNGSAPLDAVVNLAASQMTTTNTISQFVFAGDTYLVMDRSSSNGFASADTF